MPNVPGFEYHRAYLGHVRPSYTCSGTSCAKHSSVGSSIASGMAAAITTGHQKIKKNVNNHNITRPIFAVKHVHFKY
jgi:hypothetical protein